MMLKNSTKYLLYISVFSVVLGTILSSIILFRVDSGYAKMLEESRPVKINVTLLTHNQCSDCYDINRVLTDLKSQNVKIETENVIDYSTEEGKSLAEQHKLVKLPNIIITGEVDKPSLSQFVSTWGEIQNNTFTINNMQPVYFDIASNKEVGKVSAQIITDPACTDCKYTNLLLDGFKKVGIKIVNEQTINYNSTEGRVLTQKYNITKIPAVVFSPDIAEYTNLKANWSQIGTVENDNSHVTRNILPPYRDLSLNKVQGYIDITYLVDNSCANCFDPHEKIGKVLLEGFGVAFRTTRDVDIASIEGKRLLSKYKITKVPSLILTPELEVYNSLALAWKEVGTVESDEYFVYRNPETMGLTFKNLENGEIVEAQQ